MPDEEILSKLEEIHNELKETESSVTFLSKNVNDEVILKQIEIQNELKELEWRIGFITDILNSMHESQQKVEKDSTNFVVPCVGMAVMLTGISLARFVRMFLLRFSCTCLVF